MIAVDSSGSSDASAAVGGRWLQPAAVFFAIAVLVHNGDHLRRGADALDADVFWAGTLAIVVEVGVVWLVFARHRLAPLAAAVFGLTLAAGYAFVHFTPSRTWLSDSFLDGAGALSWAAAGLETFTALVLGLVGVAALQQRGGLDAATVRRRDDTEDLATAARHPVVVVLAAVNVAIFVLSLPAL